MQNRQLYILCCMFPSLLLINENWFYVWSTETKSVSNAMWKEGNITYVTSDIQIQGFDHFSTFELLSTFRFIGYGRAVYSKKLRQLPYWQSIYSCRMFEFSQGFPLATQYHAGKTFVHMIRSWARDWPAVSVFSETYFWWFSTEALSFVENL